MSPGPMPSARASERGSRPTAFAQSKTIQYSKRSRTVREFRGYSAVLQGVGPGLRPGWRVRDPPLNVVYLASADFAHFAREFRNGYAVCGASTFPSNDVLNGTMPPQKSRVLSLSSLLTAPA